MELSALKSSAAKILRPIFGQREADQMIRILIEDLFKGAKLDMTAEDVAIWHDAIHRLSVQEPISYITGICWFLNLKLKVGPGVLIPRPETEELVVLAINRCKKYLMRRHPIKVLDIGTGSGCIALALQSAIPDCELYALDRSKEALEIAQENATQLHSNVHFLSADILDKADWPGLPAGLKIIVSNPPYIRSDERNLMSISTLNHEPAIALFVEDDGMLFYRHIAEFGLTHLDPGGTILVEINEFLGKQTSDLFKSFGYQHIVVHQDLSNKDRIIECLKT